MPEKTTGHPLAPVVTSFPVENAAIDRWLAQPPAEVVERVKNHAGDYAILGIGGKMGTHLGLMLVQALARAGRAARVYGVSRFSRPETRAALDAAGLTTIACDLGDAAGVARLPRCEHVLYLSGQKFGTDSAPDETWVQNTIVPSLVAQHFRSSRTVVFSTGCVYPFARVDGPGCREDEPVAFLGEYASTCVGRERIFTHFSRRFGTPQLIFRLNYSVELRYGVLVDIALRVRDGLPVDVTTSHVNAIWQGDAVARALLCLDHVASPPRILNVTGPEKISVRAVATEFARRFGVEPVFSGEESPSAWLADASESIRLFGPPSVTVEQMIDFIARHLGRGGQILGRPTHFESRNGRF